MRDTILEILEELRPDVDFEKETKLIDDKILESFDIVSLVSELTDEFDITIRPKELTLLKLQYKAYSIMNVNSGFFITLLVSLIFHYHLKDLYQ